jgi:8-oxo-dGTP pyrophosphatase MutT (NUDIX family)
MAKQVACVLILNNLDKSKILSVSRKDNHEDFGFPGGKLELDKDYDLIDTAIRETKEETGIELLRSDLTPLYTSKDSNGYLTTTYVASKYTGEINHNEPHIVDWLDRSYLLSGSFKEYNKKVLELYDKL